MKPFSHGPECSVEKSYWTTCGSCGQRVYFWSCSHGSRVIFDAIGGGWPKHMCSGVYQSLKKLEDDIKGLQQRRVSPASWHCYKCAFCRRSVRRQEAKIYNWAGLLYHLDNDHGADLYELSTIPPNLWLERLS